MARQVVGVISENLNASRLTSLARSRSSRSEGGSVGVGSRSARSEGNACFGLWTRASWRTSSSSAPARVPLPHRADAERQVRRGRRLSLLWRFARRGAAAVQALVRRLRRVVSGARTACGSGWPRASASQSPKTGDGLRRPARGAAESAPPRRSARSAPRPRELPLGRRGSPSPRRHQLGAARARACTTGRGSRRGLQPRHDWRRRRSREKASPADEGGRSGAPRPRRSRPRLRDTLLLGLVGLVLDEPKLLAGKVEFKPEERDGQAGFRFQATGTLEKLLAGFVPQAPPELLTVVPPTGLEPVLPP